MEEIKALVNTVWEISFIFLNFCVSVWNALAAQPEASLHKNLKFVCRNGYPLSAKYKINVNMNILILFSIRFLTQDHDSSKQFNGLKGRKIKNPTKQSIHAILFVVCILLIHTNTWLHFLFPKLSIICSFFAQKLPNTEALFAHECLKSQCDRIAVESWSWC